ncbi:hypothetical protein K432DRAFT_345716 [Lepidopterella palustris CBS 459.81]|uniref:UBX domain-containing protein n=1 Tax=Lepidopterella palustris CBS 459.81 TaxID=1314670 RepID=A0A8E2JIP2_9PEZI|nr:hypothetical protein K432DRAFT_345716 [Lepidopterella palustris CBS 459.81]
MASHLVVVHPTARTVKIPTTPGTYLTDVRDEACKKLNVKPDQFTLKYNNKPIALSQQVRLANLPQGARLDLVQSSRSPTVISVALQLPDSEKNIRLTQKFASNTSLWEILRHFESGRETNYNFTQRGVPQMSSNGSAGTGRLNYESPVITVMPGHRERSNFVELQQTLGQLGFENGSALLRLSFTNSGTPLEEAMAEISQYFKPTKDEPPIETASTSSAHTVSIEREQFRPIPENSTPEAMEGVAGQNDQPDPMEAASTLAPVPAESASETGPISTPESKGKSPDIPPQTQHSRIHNIQIFSAPNSSTPQAARTAFNDMDYVPTIEHAKAHQAALQGRSRNTRLLSDKEIAEQEAARLKKLNAVAEKGVTLRIRMPDENQVQASFGRLDTAATLYDFVRGLIEHDKQPFQLRYVGPRGAPVIMRDGPELLVQDLKFSGREAVTFVWSENASNEARLSRKTLKKEWQDKAQVLKVEEPVTNDGPVEPVASKNDGQKKASGGSSADKEAKLKNILGMGKGFFKR